MATWRSGAPAYQNSSARILNSAPTDLNLTAGSVNSWPAWVIGGAADIGAVAYGRLPIPSRYTGGQQTVLEILRNIACNCDVGRTGWPLWILDPAIFIRVRNPVNDDYSTQVSPWPYRTVMHTSFWYFEPATDEGV